MTVSIYYLYHKPTGEPFYVGATRNPLTTRFSAHRHNKAPWASQINWANVGITEIESCDINLSIEIEKYWISQFKTWGFPIKNSKSAQVYNLPAEYKPPISVREGSAQSFVIQIRKEQGLTIDELAEIAEVDADSIYRYETGKRTPSMVVLNKMFDALGYELVFTPKK